MVIPKFDDKKKLFKWLVENKKELITFKRATIKHTDIIDVPDALSIIKSLNTSHTDDLDSGIITRSLIGNTYNWLDRHDDVHIDAIFTKSISENWQNVFHLHDHLQMLSAKVGQPIKIYEKVVAWKDLGVNIPGTTTILVMDSSIQKDMNPAIFTQYLTKQVTQHSVGMYYVKLELAVNDPEMKAEYAVFSKHISSIGNMQKALDQGYFWAIYEAKLHEISAVLQGSNELTPTIENTSKGEKKKPLDLNLLTTLASNEIESKKTPLVNKLLKLLP